MRFGRVPERWDQGEYQKRVQVSIEKVGSGFSTKKVGSRRVPER